MGVGSLHDPAKNSEIEDKQDPADPSLARVEPIENGKDGKDATPQGRLATAQRQSHINPT